MLGRLGKLNNLLNLVSSPAKSIKNFSDIGALLHGNNPQLVLFVHPDKEAFSVVVEDSPSIRPVSVQAASLKEPVSFFEKEMVVDQLLFVLLAH